MPKIEHIKGQKGYLCNFLMFFFAMQLFSRTFAEEKPLCGGKKVNYQLLLI